MNYIHVILPLRLEWLPSYCTHHELEPGQMVSVRFSGKKYLGVVWRCGITPDIEESRIQEIDSVEDSLPRISSEEMKLWKFISEYYLCSLGEVFKAAYPGMKLRSEQAAAGVLDRLKAKLAKTEAALQGKHCERVRLRLEAEKQETLSRINAYEQRKTGIQASLASSQLSPGKPLLIKGGARLDIYRHHITDALEAGGQVLVLCPETAFCNKLFRALVAEIPEQIRLVHAEQSAASKRDTADSLRAGTPCVVVGARSAIFLPFTRLSLVIIDEEQDISYKQSEPAPRYHGRDCAIYLAGIHRAKVILGSACPSLESIYNCNSGKYQLQNCSSNPDNCEIIDINAEKRKNGMSGPWSRKAIEALRRYGGKVHIVRGWEQEDELLSSAQELLPGMEVSISRLSELKRKGSEGATSIIVMQADALVSKDDFRSDEKALQIMTLLSSMCSRLIIQTGVPQRFDPSKEPESLLEERRQFGFPPFTRLIDKKRKGGDELTGRYFLEKGPSLNAEKERIAAKLEAWCYLDVDPQ